jgi:flagellar basal-body rod protein FlgC
MQLGRVLSPLQISASGLAAERQRMEVVANNIANAYTTRAVGGGPYRRQQAVFAELVAEQRTNGGRDLPGMAGVRLTEIRPDLTEFPVVHDPGHPDADENGNVRMPNVTMPHEMVDLITASRAYEANLKALQTFRQMMENTLTLLRGAG